MADAVDPTKEPDGSDDSKPGDTGKDLTLEEMKAAYEAEKKAREAAEAKAAKEAAKAREVIEQRDKLKADQKAKAEAEGDYAKALEIEKARVAEIEAQYNAKIKAIEDEQRAELLKQLPESSRDEWKDADIATIKRAIKLLPEPEQRIGTHNGRPGTPNANAKKWNDMTAVEQAEYAETHSQAELNRIIAESFGG